VEGPMNFLLKQTRFVIELSTSLFIQIIEAGLNSEANTSLRFDLIKNEEEVLELKKLETNMIYLLKLKEEPEEHAKLVARFIN
jgi:hypothetical protein